MSQMVSPISVLIEKMRKEVWNSGSLNTPEPEELREIHPSQPAVKASGNLHSIKAKRQSADGNRTFHKYAGDLWSIEAGKRSRCSLCPDPIIPGQEITLFETAQGWAHFIHAVDQPTGDSKLEWPFDEK